MEGLIQASFTQETKRGGLSLRTKSILVKVIHHRRCQRVDSLHQTLMLLFACDCVNYRARLHADGLLRLLLVRNTITNRAEFNQESEGENDYGRAVVLRFGFSIDSTLRVPSQNLLNLLYFYC